MKREPKYGFIRTFQRTITVALFLALIAAPYAPIAASVASAAPFLGGCDVYVAQLSAMSTEDAVSSGTYDSYLAANCDGWNPPSNPLPTCPQGMECLVLERTSSYGPLNPGYGTGVRSVGETANQLCIEHGYQSYVATAGYWAKYEWASPSDNYQRDYVNGQWTTYLASGGNDEIWTKLTCQRPISAPSNAPTISWTESPASAACDAQYRVTVAAHDQDGDLIAVSIDKDGTPFAYADGGDGTDGSSTNPTTDQGPKTVTFTAWADDAAGNRSETITHTVTIGSCGGTPTDTQPDGVLDSASCDAINGWAYDPDTSSSQISVHFYADGPAGSGTFLGAADTTGFRPDVNAVKGISGNHGFSFATPASLKDGNPHQIYAYGINTNSSGVNYHLGSSPKSFTCQAPVNVAPNAPSVTGPATGGTGSSHTFTATATDPNGDSVAYGFDWDNNGTVDQYTNFVPSGTSASLANTWSAPGAYTFRVVARDSFSAVSDPSLVTITITNGGGNGGNTAPNTATIQGPTAGTVNTSYSFTATATDPQGDAIEYGFDWDNNGSVDEWTAQTISGVSASRSHSWPTAGVYTVAVFARDAQGAVSAAATHQISISGPANVAPAAPTVTGPTSGGIGSHAFSAVSTDPNGDTVSYGFDWDNNGTVDEYTGYVTSGTSASLAHTWNAVGSYTFRVVARDSLSAVSDATLHTINITNGGGNGGNTAPNTPLIQGPATGTTDVANSFTATATDPEGNQVRYGFDWENDGTIDQWTALVDSGVSASLSHAYGAAGTYTVSVVAEDSSSAQSGEATHNIVISGSTGGSNAPVISSVTGPATGDVNVSYTFTATATDPQGDSIQYGFDWDNNGAVGSDSAETWSSLAPSGTPASRSMSWPTSGAKAFQVFARDASGNVSSPFSGSITISGTTTSSFSFSLPANSFTSENGGTASFTVVLGSAPIADVTIPVSSSDLSEATTSVTALIFTPANWNVPQTVTVTGLDDSIADGNVAYTVNLGPSASSAIAYNNLPAQSVSLTNMDNETTGGGNTPGTGGGGGGGGRSGGPCIGFGCPTGGSGGNTGDVLILIDQPAPGGSVAGVTFTPPTRKYCPVDEFLTSYLKIGAENNPNEVKKLQYYLNTYESAGLEVDGFFGTSTEAAVKAYQAKYADEILAPWGTTVPTGIVYITTSAHINRIFCGDNPWYTGTDDLSDILNPVLYPEVDNSSDFEGDIGANATSSNVAGVFGAITQDILNILKDIPWYPLLIVLLLILGAVFIGQTIMNNDMNTPDGKASLTRGVVILLIATVLNVLNTMSFMINPAWLQDALGMGSQWVLGLNLVNLAAIIVLCAVYLVSNRAQDGK